jgi:hypothetical protein
MERGLQHVGGENGRQEEIDRGSSRGCRVFGAHAVFLQRLPATEQFAIDAANLVEGLADGAKVLEVLSDRVVNLLWDIVHRRC